MPRGSAHSSPHPWQVTTVPTRARHRYSSGSRAHRLRATCDTLSSALHEAAHAQQQDITDVWIVRRPMVSRCKRSVPTVGARRKPAE